jgi:methylglutaconyl-CoA hydratase
VDAKATRFERRGPAAWITLDSPSNRNALSHALVSELDAHLRTAMDDPAVRCIVLTGNGPAFCAGADLRSRGEAVTEGSGERSPLTEILMQMWEGPKPVIAAVNGHAFGGGIGLVAAADIAIGSTAATFSFSETRLGLIPAMISVVVVPVLGVQRTMQLFLTSERFDAERAVAWGLLHRAVAPDELAAAAQREAEAIAAGGPVAIAESKRLVRTVSRLPMDEAFVYAEERIAALFQSEEAAEGMAAFREKRKPRWVPEG